MKMVRVKGFVNILLALMLFCFCSSFSQQAGSTSISSPDSGRIDTNYVRNYKNKLIIGLWQSERRFDIYINQKLFPLKTGTAINYIANSNYVSGISLDYDIIGLAFGYRSLPGGNKRTGNTHYLDLGLNINTRRLRLENSFRKYTGFYDNNSSNYIHPFTDTTNYYQNPSLNIRVVKTKLIYSFNKRKFALGAGYANVKRQIKSKGSWLLVGNFYSMNLFSNSSFIPPPLRKDYGDTWDGLNRTNIYACSAGFGGTYTLVFWKRFYFNFLATFGLESQFRYYYTSPENARYTSTKVQSAGDWRTSLGYNGKRFFIRGSTIYDINHFESKDLKFDMKFVAGSFDFGYRFDLKAPKSYGTFQESKFYKMM
jgi:hypothetical protein